MRPSTVASAARLPAEVENEGNAAEPYAGRAYLIWSDELHPLPGTGREDERRVGRSPQARRTPTHHRANPEERRHPRRETTAARQPQADVITGQRLEALKAHSTGTRQLGAGELNCQKGLSRCGRVDGWVARAEVVELDLADDHVQGGCLSAAEARRELLSRAGVQGPSVRTGLASRKWPICLRRALSLWARTGVRHRVRRSV